MTRTYVSLNVLRHIMATKLENGHVSLNVPSLEVFFITHKINPGSVLLFAKLQLGDDSRVENVSKIPLYAALNGPIISPTCALPHALPPAVFMPTPLPNSVCLSALQLTTLMIAQEHVFKDVLRLMDLWVLLETTLQEFVKKIVKNPMHLLILKQ
jgi:hypothetical protein